MTDPTNYRIENIRQKELSRRAVRREILSSEAEHALDMILDAPAPASLIQSFPDQDLYYLLHKIGGADFIPVLAMATSEQWEYILDVEIWDNDRLDLDGMTKTLDLLFQADPQRLLRWTIMEKPDFLEFYLSKNMEIIIREHDEIPPETFDDYITFDDKFYFRFPDKPALDDDEMPIPTDSIPAWDLIEKMMDTLAQMDLSVFHGLMLETKALLTIETEEEQFRLKTVRLAEKGFLPYHEAIGIYQPTRLSSIRKRRQPLESQTLEYDPDIPLPPQFFTQFTTKKGWFTSALQQFGTDAVLVLEGELAALINKVISADRIKLREKQDLEQAFFKTCDLLNLGLEKIMETAFSSERASQIINDYFLEDIFRTGSRSAAILGTQARSWFQSSFMHHNKLPLSFLDEKFLGIIGGLFLDRPLFFDNYAHGDLYRNFNSLSDIASTQTALDQIMALDHFLSELTIDISTFEQGVLTYKTLILTLWAKNRIGLKSTLEPIAVSDFKPFFSELFSRPGQGLQTSDLIFWAAEITGRKDTDLSRPLTGILSDLIAELEAEYNRVDPENIDPRFVPHFLLKLI